MKLPWQRNFSDDEISAHLTASRKWEYEMNEDYNQGHPVGHELAAIYLDYMDKKAIRNAPDDRRDMDLSKLPFVF